MSLQTETSSIEPGAVLGGKYRVDHIVGQGGMGAVYAVTHLELGRKAAIKTLLPRFLSDETVARRFRQEAQMAASIGHDNICEVVDIATSEDGTTYMVMPLLVGDTLAALFDKRQLSLESLVDILAQTLSGLDAAHLENIVHRDLKPHNIFVTQIGDRENFVKLLDFGISKILDQEVVTKLTQSGAMLGTPFYMSPEQARGDDEEIDHRADIYALGVILYEAVTGTCPFRGISYNKLIYNILCGKMTPVKEINPTVPGELEQVILKAMAYNREDRYGSADEMREALTGVLSRVDTHACEPPPQHTPFAASSGHDGILNQPFDAGGLVRQKVGQAETVVADAYSATAFAGVSKETPFESVTTIHPIRKKRSFATAILVLSLLVVGSLGYLLVQSSKEDQAIVVPLAEPTGEQVQMPEAQPSLPPVVEAAPNPVDTADPIVEDKVAEPRDEPAKKDEKRRTRRKKKEKPALAEQEKSRDTDDESEKDITVKGRFGTKFTPEY